MAARDALLRGAAVHAGGRDRPPGQRSFVPLCEQGGIAVFATPGLAAADEVQLELGRRGHLRAYWNGQSWIG